MADVKVQRGTSSIAPSGTTVTITAGTAYTAPAALSRAFIRITAVNAAGCESSAITSSADVINAVVSNPANLLTSITFQRTTSSASTGMHIDWEIVEYIGSAGGANEFIVRQQEALTYVTTSNTANGTAATVVSDANVCVFLTGLTGGATAGLRDTQSYFTWDSTNHWATANRDRNSNIAATVSYAAVEFTGSNWTVQRVQHAFTLAGTTEHESITSVGSLTRAFVEVQHIPTSGESGNNYEKTCQVWLDATTTVAFLLDSQATAVDQVAVAWVVSNSQTGTGAANCNRYTGTYATSGTTNVTVTAVADLAQSSITEISQTNTQNTGSPGRDQASHTLTTTTNVAVFHTGTAGTTTYRFAVFEWPTAQGGGGGRTFFMLPGLDGHSSTGPKQFNPALYHRHPAISLEAYRRERARTHREFLAKVRAA